MTATAVATIAAATKPARHVPQRTCVACRTTGGKKGLLRVVRPPQAKDATGEAQTSAVVYDATGKKNGRGAYVCASITCVNLAFKQKKLERALKAVVPEETVAQLKEAAQAVDAAAVEPEPPQAEPAQKAI